MRGIYLIALTLLVYASTASTASAGPQIVNFSQLLSGKIQYRVGSLTKTKRIYCLGKKPGKIKETGAGTLFTPFTTTISRLRAKHIAGLKLSTQLALQSTGAKKCEKLYKASHASATPTPLPFGSGNFDMYGNVTAQGKVLFGIPAWLNANTSNGSALASSYCSCHGDKLGRGFPTLRSAIAQSPMLFNSNQITDAMLADIAAYLNRYRL